MAEGFAAGAAAGEGAPRVAASYVLAFDTANEVIAIGVGRLDAAARAVEAVGTFEQEARRASNTQLLPQVDALLARCGVAREHVVCVCVGRGPGSFTGVRIAMATAKGIASALEVPLLGVSTLDAVAWGAWERGARGGLCVLADAMRREVYPARYRVDDRGAWRETPDRVVKAEELAAGAGEGAVAAVGGGPESPAAAEGAALFAAGPQGEPPLIAGDGLKKYAELFAPLGTLLPPESWTPSGRGLLLALQAAWRAGECDPLDAQRHHPGLLLPVYTRLSDAEENERARRAQEHVEGGAVSKANLRTGVQDSEALAHPSPAHHSATMHEQSTLVALPDEQGISYAPLDASHAAAVAALEAQVMGSDAWNERLVADELPRKDRTWWAAFSGAAAEGAGSGEGAELVGYAGGWIVDGALQILKVGVSPAFRRRGIARELIARVAADARNLGARSCSLEVRAGNEGARAFYEALGLGSIGVRPRYYSDREDACIMEGPLPVPPRDVAGMELQVDAAHDAQRAPAGAGAEGDAGAGASGASGAPAEPVRPLILAIESSCDETAAAVVDGTGTLSSDVVASQIDFHARFGGVVPEIASRKHIEAICGVCDECLEAAAAHLGRTRVRWRDLDAVAVTYAPGLVGALVVGVAFAKGAAWAIDVPFIGVNHLEGHLYANRIGCPDFAPPAVVSLVSGGNTLLVHMRDWGDYVTLGSTIDDAVGEAFDKVAKALGLGYPGGPVISRYAAEGNPDAIPFPRAMLHSGDLRFSLSGLKTAVVTYVANERAAGRELNVPDVCASFQQAVVDVQVAKAKRALEQTGARTLCVGGGVAANPVLRSAYRKLCDRMGVRLVLPPLSACGDNAGMIALVALDRYRQGKFFPLSADAQAHVNLDDAY